VTCQALLITGAPGSGKSTLLDTLSTLLEIDEVTFGAVEGDELARGWPYPSLPEVLPRLAALTALQREAGRNLMLVVATTENDGELEQVIEAIGAERTLVVCLRAPAEVVAARVAAREPEEWPGKQSLVDHASDLALAMPALRRIDAIVDTLGRPAQTVASEVHGLLKAWVGR
jgi:energy-coupling factor transporter ATP-binding protein EcfA2